MCNAIHLQIKVCSFLAQEIITEKLDFNTFKKLWLEVNKRFECINTTDTKEAYKEYLLKGLSLRFSRKNEFIPNMETKFTKTELDNFSLKNKIEIKLNKNKMYTSCLELQISFKLFLGSEKEIEDAKHIYDLLKDKLNTKLLEELNRKLKVEEQFNKYLKWKFPT